MMLLWVQPLCVSTTSLRRVELRHNTTQGLCQLAQTASNWTWQLRHPITWCWRQPCLRSSLEIVDSKHSSHTRTWALVALSAQTRLQASEPFTYVIVESAALQSKLKAWVVTRAMAVSSTWCTLAVASLFKQHSQRLLKFRDLQSYLSMDLGLRKLQLSDQKMIVLRSYSYKRQRTSSLKILIATLISSRMSSRTAKLKRALKVVALTAKACKWLNRQMLTRQDSRDREACPPMPICRWEALATSCPRHSSPPQESAQSNVLLHRQHATQTHRCQFTGHSIRRTARRQNHSWVRTFQHRGTFQAGHRKQHQQKLVTIAAFIDYCTKKRRSSRLISHLRRWWPRKIRWI